MACIQPGAVIGIIGGGQLGRMMAIAAAQLGYKTHIFTPERDSPAQQVASFTTVAAYDDMEALQAFASSVQVVTYEFENIPHASLTFLEKAITVAPGADILRISQHREREKTFLRDHGIPTAPFALLHTLEDLQRAVREIGMPGIAKTAQFGYDGKGQVFIRNQAACEAAWEALATREAVYEGFIDFDCEVSVIVARDAAGGCKTYPVVQNIHVNHILDTTIAPAPVPHVVQEKATAIAKKIAEALDLHGLLAVEMFVTKQGEVLVNELAPRPHNSGHWTLDACVTDQFQQAIRAVCGLPLGSTQPLCKATMKNLVGREVNEWQAYLNMPNAKLHLYGKHEIRAGRKMGHVTLLEEHVCVKN